MLAVATLRDPAGLRSDEDIAEAFGLDSLDRLTFAADLEDHFDVTIPDEKLSELHSITDIARAVAAAKHGGAS